MLSVKPHRSVFLLSEFSYLAGLFEGKDVDCVSLSYAAASCPSVDAVGLLPKVFGGYGIG